MDSNNDTILVLGAYRQTLAVLRSLGTEFNLVLGCREAATFVDKSKHVSKTWQHPPCRRANADRFLAALNRLLGEHPHIRHIFPVGDVEILFLSEHRERLPDGVSCVMPNADAVMTCQKKAEMFERVRALGVPTARYANVTNRGTLLQAADHIGYPCIVKPDSETSSIFGKKAFIAGSRESLRKELIAHEAQPDAIPEKAIVQQYCLGQRRNIYFFADHGVVRASVEIAIDRTDQWDGTGYAIEGHSVARNEEWAAHLGALVESLEYHGAGCLQFLFNAETGDSSFLEINARLGANFACALDCGLDLPKRWLKQVSTDRRPLTPGQEQCKPKDLVKATRPTDAMSPAGDDFDYPVGRRYVWLYGDLLGLKQAWAAGQLTMQQAACWIWRMIVATCRSQTHVTFRWNDPVPTIVVFAALFAGPFSRLAGRALNRQPLTRLFSQSAPKFLPKQAE